LTPLQQVAADPEWQPPNLDRGPLGRCITCHGRIHWAYQNRPTEEGPQHSICLLAEDFLGKVYEFAATDPPQVGYLFIESLLRWATSFVQLFFLLLIFLMVIVVFYYYYYPQIHVCVYIGYVFGKVCSWEFGASASLYWG